MRKIANAIVGVLIGATIVALGGDVVAQVIRLNDNTTGMKAVLFDVNGSTLSVGGGSQYPEDSLHVNADIGTFAMVVQSASCGTALSGNGDRSFLQIDANGQLCVAGGGGGTQYAHNSTQATPTGTVALGLDGTTLRAIAVNSSGQQVLAALSAGTNNIGDVDVLTLPAIPTGSNVIGAVTQSGGPWSVTGAVTAGDNLSNPTNGIPTINYLHCWDTAGTNWDRCPISTANKGNADASTTRVTIADDDNNIGQWTPITYISTGSASNETAVKGSAGRYGGVMAWNTSNADAFLRCAANTTGGTTPGTTAPDVLEMLLPSATSAHGGFTSTAPTGGAAFATGMTCWIVTEEARTGTTAVAANKAGFTVFYR